MPRQTRIDAYLCVHTQTGTCRPLGGMQRSLIV